MENQFVFYDLALKLKELGFNEECLGFYVPLLDGTQEFELMKFESQGKKIVLAPLWQQAFDWIESNFGLSGEIHKYEDKNNKYWFITIINNKGEELTNLDDRYSELLNKSHQDIEGNYINQELFTKFLYEDKLGFKTILEARQDCLEKLIELCNKINKI